MLGALPTESATLLSLLPAFVFRERSRWRELEHFKLRALHAIKFRFNKTAIM
jgi:hypothetical protein